MNIIKLTKRMLILLFLLISFNASADSVTTNKYLKQLEIGGLKINLFKDGTGFVKNDPCSDCASRYYKITQNTKAAKNGVAIDIQQAKKRAGKSVGISVDPKTREVHHIYWYER